jgi:hypothetical protein
MRTALLLVAILAPLAFAAQPWHLSGRVIDENGRPVEGAFFQDPATADTETFEHFTNAEGRVDIWSDSPRLVLRKSAYGSVIIRPEDAKKREFAMRKAPLFPTCGRFNPKIADPFEVSFDFRQPSQVVLLKTGIGIDYTFAQYGIKGQRDVAQIRRVNNGASLPVPDDYNVSRSVQYSERAYFIAGMEIIDARGSAASGLRWREIRRASESLSYRGAAPALAKLLDKVLDGVCLASVN